MARHFLIFNWILVSFSCSLESFCISVSPGLFFIFAHKKVVIKCIFKNKRKACGCKSPNYFSYTSSLLNTFIILLKNSSMLYSFKKLLIKNVETFIPWHYYMVVAIITAEMLLTKSNIISYCQCSRKLRFVFNHSENIYVYVFILLCNVGVVFSFN